MAVAVVALAVTALIGCSGQREPGSYTASVKKDFVAQCWITRVLDQNADLEVTNSDPLADQQKALEEDAPSDDVATAKESCGCAYAAIKKDVKFSAFKSLNDDLRENPEKALPDSFTKAYADCDLAPQA